jgi:hypothetical protein
MARAQRPTPCQFSDLSVKEGESDAAMGGVRATDYIFTNKSAAPCTLNGYPRVELTTSKGVVARRATHSEQLPTDEQKMPPQIVTLDPGKTAWVRIYYNAGGAGHMGKPCPTYPKTRVSAPGVIQFSVLRSNIQSCPRTDFMVTSVRGGNPH